MSLSIERLQALYTRRAAVYDYELMPVAPLRREAIAALELAPGQTVLDVGGGTGLSLPALTQAVGERGRVIAIEPCTAMMSQARRRAAVAAWRTPIDFVDSTVEEAPLETLVAPGSADAALFFFTHDALQQPLGLSRVLGALKPGARVVAAGLVWAAPWWPLSNLFVMGAAMHSIISPQRLDCPWHDLAPRLASAEVERRWLGSAYLLKGWR
ncbi:Protein-L-isoaspartate(D-aspartate) O-methyltransferase (PCMT) [Roseateles sp. YR242]|uniref:class I SAM-dependent methyltransferase n=1 Tax=Roseateles sp. YR242 TaxID=1855305 RepID=UPI0008B657DF|nr:methyltransferase domain-containing protein [Roseateles sp. YR242]SEK68262.1 Protein-L-isoaspartate(D-aspartate) O-methyltransferase (PCMT) [Roseateles sp. YR242]